MWRTLLALLALQMTPRQAYEVADENINDSCKLSVLNIRPFEVEQIRLCSIKAKRRRATHLELLAQASS
jgi:hypothetical protein